MGDPMAWHVLRLLCFGSTVDFENSLRVDGEPASSVRDWRASQKDAFVSLIHALVIVFPREPDKVCDLLTCDVSDPEDAGRIMANFIGWLSPQRRFLPDIRTAAIKVIVGLIHFL